MTEMAYGSVGTVEGEAVLSRWWRTLDKSVLTAILILFSIGLLLGLASSPPLAEKNGLAPFHYVYRQAIFGSLALFVMLVFSMLPSKVIRRLGVIGFLLCLVGIYLALAWVFASWARPIVVMSIIPFGLIGTLWGHYLWGINLSMFSIIGLITLEP